MVVGGEQAVGADQRHPVAVDEDRQVGRRVDHERLDGGDERDAGDVRDVGEGELGAGRRESVRHRAVVGLERRGRGQGDTVDDAAGDHRPQRVVVADPHRHEGRMQGDRLLERRAEAAQDEVVEAAVVGDRRHHVVDVGAGDRQVVVGARQVEVERHARAGLRRDEEGRQAAQLHLRREAGVGDQRLLEAGALARRLPVDEDRIAVALRRLRQAAALVAGGQAVADRDVAGEVGGAGVDGERRQGREQGERQGAREDSETRHRRFLLWVPRSIRSRAWRRRARPWCCRCRRRDLPR